MLHAVKMQYHSNILFRYSLENAFSTLDLLLRVMCMISLAYIGNTR